MKSLNESKQGFWGVLARKAKAILDDDNDNETQQLNSRGRTNTQMPATATRGKVTLQTTSSRHC